MKTIISILIFSFASTAQAGLFGGGGMDGSATLLEQLTQTTALGRQLTEVRNIVAQNVEILRVQTLQNQALGSGVLGGLLNQNLQDVNSLHAYSSALARLINDSNELNNTFRTRLVDYGNSGLTYEEYAQQESARIAAGDRRRAQFAEHEISVMQNVNNDVLFAQKMQAKIPATVGEHESVQLLNTQMNRVVAQNATLIQLQTANSRNEKQNAEDATIRKASLSRAVGTATAQEREWLRSEIDRLNTAPTEASRPSSAAPLPMTDSQRRALGL